MEFVEERLGDRLKQIERDDMKVLNRQTDFEHSIGTSKGMSRLRKDESTEANSFVHSSSFVQQRVTAATSSNRGGPTSSLSSNALSPS
ncbi:unnamed protein product [Ilex paraguariensis]|uniref:Uncharacterized protein n=1 Tax=Ilex paraguariensis TaxID=185542 RepID=A0ABC8UST6_9AQUA